LIADSTHPPDDAITDSPFHPPAFSFFSFSNTAEALKDFDLHPWRYLPNSSDWQTFIFNHFPTLVDFDSIPVISNISDPLEYQIASIQLSILATQGALIPTAKQASLLINSTRVYQDMEWPSALQTQLSTYYNLVNSVQDPNAAMHFVRNNLFQVSCLHSICVSSISY
jgi:hypothetical protein